MTRRLRGCVRSYRRCGCAVLAGILCCYGVFQTALAEGSLHCGLEEHVHTQQCYTRTLVCDLPQSAIVPETGAEDCGTQPQTHTDAGCDDQAAQCCALTDEAQEQGNDTEAGSEASAAQQEQQPHIHTDACYEQKLICALQEHTHTADCLSDPTADIEQPADWERTIPSVSDCETAKQSLVKIAVSQLGYHESTENFRTDADGARHGYTRYGAWYGDPYGAWQTMFVSFCLFYAGVRDAAALQQADAAQLLSAAKERFPQTSDPQSGMLLFYEEASGLPAVGIVESADGTQITLIAGDTEDTVAQIILCADDPAILWTTDPDSELQTEPKTAESEEPPLLLLQSTETLVQKKAEKDNTAQLDRISTADTRDYITLNLFNYGSNINEKYLSDKKYPGFQQEYGTYSGAKVSDCNFGNNVTADLAAGINDLTNAGGAINNVTDKANSPISRTEDVMYPTLKNGYPALKDGTSLGYLFGADTTYGKRQNSKNISGLFQYDEETGAYTYNSRENHAQFDPQTDSFQVYRQMLTPNMTLYPFGNFLPFNDIVHDAKHVPDIDRAYFAEIAASAQSLHDAGKSVFNNEYLTLAKALTTWIGAMDAIHPSGWNAVHAINAYFNAVVGSGFDFSERGDVLEKLYCLDYDVPTDFYFGLEMSMTFLQPRGGLTGSDKEQPMRFFFSGDDDVWVYVDDVLFLDLSGIHRHVGGEIDFESGTVRYYSLDPEHGDLSDTPWREQRFSEILGTSDGLSEKGTFPDYSSHDLHFYYMERGSGSGVCCLNFNMPLLRENTISVAKTVSSDEGSSDVLGDPDFLFQLLREDGDLFLTEGAPYTVTDASGRVVETRTAQAHGVIRIKKGQTAVIDGVAENAGRYFVRELLPQDAVSQYGSVCIDGNTVSDDTYAEVFYGEDGFFCADSAVKDAADGAAAFCFENQVTSERCGVLEIGKILETYAAMREQKIFPFRILFDTVPVPAGTAYSVHTADGTSVQRTVETEGEILLAHGETARICNILAGTRFIVEEIGAKEAGYTVSYVVDGGAKTDGYAAGTVRSGTTVRAVVTNAEQGVSVRIPIEKRLIVDDGERETFAVRVQQMEDADTDVPMENGFDQQISVSAGTVSELVLHYAEPTLPTLPAVFHYRVFEQDPAEHDAYRYDTSVYRLEITVDRAKDGSLTADPTNIRKDDVPYDTDAPFEFTNMRLSELTVQKTVQGAAVGTEAAFPMVLQLRLNGDPYQGACSAKIGTDERKLMFDEEGKVSFSLHADEAIRFCDLPYGASWTLTEPDTDGFRVGMRVNDAEILADGCAQGQLSSVPTVVQVINASDYMLPSAGGRGRLLFDVIGFGILASAVRKAAVLHRKK